MASPPRKVFVTGASGFVGARLVRQLVAAGEHVRALVRATSSSKALAGIDRERLELVQGDVRIEHTMYRALAGCDRLYHVAAVNRLWDKDERVILDGAVGGTEATLSAAHKRGIEKVVYTSSAAVFGVADGDTPMTEEHDQNLADPETYIRAKTEAERVALSFFHEKGLPVVAVNPTAILGPGDVKPTQLGEAILRFLAWRAPIAFPSFEGGINVVDVDDVARGHILAMQKGVPGERYILGGDNVSWEQLFTMLADVTGLDSPGTKLGKGLLELVARIGELNARLGGGEPPVTYRATRDFVGKNSWVSSEKAERELGYSHRPAEKALIREVQWFLEQGYVRREDARRIRVDLRAV